jgi:hypothetical protein
VIGARQLENRLTNVGRIQKPMLTRLALRTVRYAKETVNHKTRTTSRSIRVESITDEVATVVAAGAAVYLEYGTRPHDIRPRRRKALRFAAKGQPVRLTGAPKKGSAVVFAKVVRHPGTQPYPFMRPSAERAIRDEDLAGIVINAWNAGA